MSQIERRNHRSASTSRALVYQLRASMHKANLSGFVLADEDGLCLASAGDDDACDEVAAHLPIFGQKVPTFEGVLYGASVQWDIQMERLQIGDIRLYLCAIGASDARNDQMQRSMAGVTRILDPMLATA
ncbi:MAG: hypothetical protein JKY56_06905 [Kofleriaceae bacterium]|nr:hypothetical protein [Kofleriaceae bacterium]